jgi:hypothetical protein
MVVVLVPSEIGRRVVVRSSDAIFSFIWERDIT